MRNLILLLSFIHYISADFLGNKSQIVTIPIRKISINDSTMNDSRLLEEQKDISSQLYSYSVQVKIGKSQKLFNVKLDIVSNYLFVSSEQCLKCKEQFQRQYSCLSNDSCILLNNLDQLNNNNDIIQGNIGQVDVQFGGFSSKNQPFLLGQVEIQQYQGNQEDGIFGLNLYSLIDNQAKNILKSLIEVNHLSSNSFSLYYGFEGDSQMTIGGLDKNLFKNKDDDVNYHQHEVISKNKWEISCLQVAFGGIILHNQIAITLINSGESGIRFPPNLYEKIKNNLMQNYQAYLQGNSLYLDCSKSSEVPQITLALPDKNNQNVDYSLSQLYFLQQIEKNGEQVCLFKIYMSNTEQIVLGDVFTSKFITNFIFLPSPSINFIESKANPPQISQISSSKNEEGLFSKIQKLPVYIIVLVALFICLCVLVFTVFIIKCRRKRNQQAKADLKQFDKSEESVATQDIKNNN